MKPPAWLGALMWLSVPAMFVVIDGKVSSTALQWASVNPPPHDWYNPGWLYRKLKVVDHRRVLATLTDFPIYLAFDNDADLAGHLQPSCHDFLVTRDGFKLDHEIVTCDPAAGTVHAFARVPSLSSSADTPLLVYYGNPLTGDQSNRQGVWDSHYKIVLQGGTLADSTANHIDGTAHGAPRVSISPIGKAYAFEPTRGDFVMTARAPVSRAYTLSVWFKADTRAHGNVPYALIAGTRTAGTLGVGFGYVWSSYEPWIANCAHGFNGGYPVASFGSGLGQSQAPSGGRWYLVTCSWDGLVASAYIDGGLKATGPVTSMPPFTGGLYVGGNDAATVNRSEIGLITLSDIARSREWIATQAANQWSPEAFFSTGSGQTNTAVSPVVEAFTANYTTVESGRPATLRWVVSNAKSVSIDQGVGSQSELVAGFATVYPAVTTTYKLSAMNATGLTTATVTVTVPSGPVAYFRHGWPPGTWIYGYDTDANGRARIATWEPHHFVEGDIIVQGGFATVDAGDAYHHASNLNGRFVVKRVQDATHFTLADMSGRDVHPNDNWFGGVFNGCCTGATFVGRVTPYALNTQPRGVFDGLNGYFTRHLGTGTNNGLVNLTVSHGVARVELSYQHDVRIGDKVTVWNAAGSHLGDLNSAEHVITAATATSYSFATSAADGSYSHNDRCGPGEDPSTIGGRENCLRISLFATSANPMWNWIKSTTDSWSSDAQFQHRFDGGALSEFSTSLALYFQAAAYRFWVDQANQRALRANLYILNHLERLSGVNFATVAGSDEGGSSDIGHYGERLGPMIAASYAVTSRYLTAEQRQALLDKMYNDVRDPAKQCTLSTPARKIVAAGAAQGGNGTSIVLGASDPAGDDAYVNRIVTFNDGTKDWWGRIIRYASDSKTAVVSEIVRAATNDPNEYNASSWTPPAPGTPYTILAAATIAGTTVTGYGTRFTTDVAPGDGITAGFRWPSWAFPAGEYYVSRVGSDTSVTVVTATASLLNTTARPLFVLKQWATGNCGLLHRLKWQSGWLGVQPNQYGGSGGINAGSVVWHRLPTWNENTGGLIAAFLIGPGGAMAEDDPRAQIALEEGQAYFWDNMLRFNLMYRTGFPATGPWYGFGNEITGLGIALQAIDAAAPDLPLPDPSGTFMANVARLKMYAALPDRAGGRIHFDLWSSSTGGDAAMLLPGGPQAATFFKDFESYFNPHSTSAGYLRDFLIRTETTVGRSEAVNQFPYFNPLVRPLDYTQQPLQYFFTTSPGQLDNCRTLTGWTQEWGCGLVRADGVISKTSWTDRSATQVKMVARGFRFDYDYVQPGSLSIYKVGRLLYNDTLTGNGPNGDGGPTGGFYATKATDIPEFGGASTLRPWLEEGDLEPRSGKIVSWAGSDSYGDPQSRYAYWKADLAGAYVPAYERVWRSVVHFKKPGTEEIVVDFWDIDVSNAPPADAPGVRVSYHYTQNGESGAPLNGDVPSYDEGRETVCPGGTCATDLNTTRTVLSREDGHAADAHGPARTAAIISRFHSPGDVFVRWDGAGYDGTQGHSYRVSVCGGLTCAKTDAKLELVTVHKIVADFRSDSTITSASLDAGPDWTGVQTLDKVALFARRGKLASSLEVTTHHPGSAQYLIAGLATGTYHVTAGGKPIVGSPFVVKAGDHSLYFESTAGAISIAR